MVRTNSWMALGICGLAVAMVAAPLAAQDVVSDGQVEQQAYLGLGVAPVPEPLVAHIAEIAGEGRGVLVAEVMKDSPAEKAGLRKYDVIIRYGDQDVYSPEQLVKLVRNGTPGEGVVLQVVRGGKVLELKAKLAGIPARPSVRGKLAERLPRWQFLPGPQQGILPGLVAPRRGQRPTDEDAASAQPAPAQPARPGEDQEPGKTPWKTFESMTVTKLEDGRYKVEINYVDADEKQIHREYVGTREEIKKAIDADRDLPPEERQHLLRTLDMQERPPVWFFPNLELLERELFNWPNFDF
ncbi:MAG: PDZ domain-containing protein [Planctomycetota bacterium]|nr:MAG: PDZ domain-containing protein [Planctomycetota bacterium]